MDNAITTEEVVQQFAKSMKLIFEWDEHPRKIICQSFPSFWISHSLVWVSTDPVIIGAVGNIRDKPPAKVNY